MNQWSRFRKLSSGERWTLLEAMALLPLTGAALRHFGFERLRARVARLTPLPERRATGGVEAPIEEARRVERMVAAAAREGLHKGNCLERSLTLWWLLRRRGLNGQLRIGVRKTEGKFEAHAWIEFDGAVLNDVGEVHRHYKPFERDLASLQMETR